MPDSVFNVYIFDRHCNCVFRADYMPPSNELDPEEHAKLVYGVVHSMLGLCQRLKQESPFISMSTSSCWMHVLHTPTNLRIVMLTNKDLDNCRDLLRTIYEELYLNYVIKNPLSLDSKITNTKFKYALDYLMRGGSKTQSPSND